MGSEPVHAYSSEVIGTGGHDSADIRVRAPVVAVEQRKFAYVFVGPTGDLGVGVSLWFLSAHVKEVGIWISAWVGSKVKREALSKRERACLDQPWEGAMQAAIGAYWVRRDVYGEAYWGVGLGIEVFLVCPCRGLNAVSWVATSGVAVSRSSAHAPSFCFCFASVDYSWILHEIGYQACSMPMSSKLSMSRGCLHVEYGCKSLRALPDRASYSPASTFDILIKSSLMQYLLSSCYILYFKDLKAVVLVQR